MSANDDLRKNVDQLRVIHHCLVVVALIVFTLAEAIRHYFYPDYLNVAPDSLLGVYALHLLILLGVYSACIIINGIFILGMTDRFHNEIYDEDLRNGVLDHDAFEKSVDDYTIFMLSGVGFVGVIITMFAFILINAL